MSAGPLSGIRVVELAGIGPAPFAGMMLADMGADVVRVDRPGPEPQPGDIANRGKRSIKVDLKQGEGAEVVLRLAAVSDILIEGLRPGVTERLGVGPERCLERNPRLVYGRVTGWGQSGPLATTAGHDIDYIAVAGALAHIGAKEKPTAPLNLVGDFGGGGMLLLAGVLAALHHARSSGSGQVVDAAMVDGAALQMTMMHDLEQRGLWDDEERAANLLDGGAPFYDTYRTSDGRHVAVGALEPQFFAALVGGLGWSVDEIEPQLDRSRWSAMRDRFATAFASRTQAEWLDVFAGSDACVAPVVTMVEASDHPHNDARETFVTIDGVRMPAPGPRFSATPSAVSGPAPDAGLHTDEVLSALGFDRDHLGRLRSAGVIE